MSPRLLRPRQTIHPEAADWANRVRTNGGSVSGTTLSAVDRFVKAIHAAGIRDRFYRVNLFCGNSDGSLAAVRTPLFRGQSLGGTQYGSATDTNFNFGPGDYAEAAGLLSNGTSKYLSTTVSPDSLGVPQTLHFSVYKAAGAWAATQEVIGTRDAEDFYQLQLRIDVATSANGFLGPTTISGVLNAPMTTGAALVTLSRASSTSLVMYSNGTSVGVGSLASATLGACANNWFVFARNVSGSAGFGTVMPLFGYSIGLGLTGPEVTEFANASRAFHLALGRSA